MFGIKLYQYVYVQCDNINTYENILSFFQKEHYFKENSNLKDLVQYNEKFKFITFTMNREFQMSYLEYLLYLKRKDSKKQEGQQLRSFFDQFQKIIEDNQFLSIGDYDIEKLWVNVNEKKQIDNIYCLNLIAKTNKSQQKITSLFIQATGSFKTLLEKEKIQNQQDSNLINNISQIVQKKYEQFSLKKQFQKFFEEEQKKLKNENFKVKPVRVAILNLAFREQVYSCNHFNYDEFKTKLIQVENTYNENWNKIKDFLFNLLQQYQVKCEKLDSVAEWKNFLRESTQNTSQLHQKAELEKLDYLLIKLMQQNDLMTEIFYQIEKPQQIIISYCQTRLKSIVTRKLNENPTLSNLISYMALLRQNDEQQLIKQLFQIILNDIKNEYKLDSLIIENRYFKIFTDQEIEYHLVELQASKINDALYPELISTGIFIDYLKSSQVYQKRRQFFLDLLSVLQNSISKPNIELAEILSNKLIECLNKNSSNLLNDLVTKIMFHYVSQVLEDNS